MTKQWILYGWIAFAALWFATPAGARGVGMIDQRPERFSVSTQYSFSQADFESSSTSTDSEANIHMAGIRVEKSIFPRLGVYAFGGVSDYEFDDRDVDNGTVFGGGFQVTVEPDPDLYLKLVGSYLSHGEEDFQNSSETFELTDDWQAGVLVGRKITKTTLRGITQQYHAYIGALFSDRVVEIGSGSTTTTHDLADWGGASLFLGFHWIINENFSFELEAEGGSSLSGTGRLQYRF